MKSRGLTIAYVLFPLILMSCSPQSKTPVFDAQVSDLNGTWFDVQPGGPTKEELLNSGHVYDVKFSWGIGKEVPNVSYAFDLKENYVALPTGGGKIFTVKKIGTSDIEVRVLQSAMLHFIYGQKLSGRAAQEAMAKFADRFVAHFTDRDHITIDHPNQGAGATSDGAFGIIPGDRSLKWFRLSGPS